jgi:superfamily I DNA/RNA helicase
MKQIGWSSFLQADTSAERTEPARRGRVVVCPGARATESALLDRIAKLQEEAAENPSVLAKPILVVVSSNALRDHLRQQIAQQLGGAAIGLAVLTLKGLAQRLLRDASLPCSSHDALFDFVAQREAANSRPLAHVLDQLEGGYSLSTAGIRDLSSAGLTPDLTEALTEICHHGGADGSALAAEVIDAARRTWQHMRDTGLKRTGDLLDDAAAALAQHGPGLLRARAVLVHGFADATGQATTFLQQIATHGAEVYLDQPPVFDAPDAEAEAPFSERLATALQLAVPLERSPAETPTAAELSLFDAPGREAEVTEVANRIAQLLDQGIVPERVAVVARDLRPYALDVRRVFRRRGVPFSGGRFPLGAFESQQRWSAVVDLIREGRACRIDRLIAARWPQEGGPLPNSASVTLEPALRARGLVTLGQLADVSDDLGSSPSAELPAPILATLQQTARQLGERIDGWPPAGYPRGPSTAVRRLMPIRPWLAR